MLKHSDDEARSGPGPEIGRLLERLASESREWAAAEAGLARIELRALKTQVKRALIASAIGVAAVLCMLLALTQAMIAAMSRLMGDAATAALLVGIAFALLALRCLFVAHRFTRWRTESIFLRWLGSRPRESDRP